VKEAAVFSNVRIVKPAPSTLVPYQEYLGSHIEVMDVKTGHRRIVHSAPKSLQAPNWTVVGQSLIYNSEGLLHRFDLTSGKSTVLPTGFANRNNNDHVLSFDGTQIGISHHASETQGNSLVYVLPVTGGTPRKITALGPSYLHGWSPDSEFVTYTAQRKGAYNIFKAPVAGGPEIQLTNTPGLDDGSEYSPDGKYIYFNSVRSGTMQIWRMQPDGSHAEQITDDGFNNWFPHISPDGKKIVFLSFGQDVAPDNHPFYKQVTLRIMPVTGGTPRVIAYVYGGQGTINVPSWSPDSKHIAFVSNTGMD
jgi:TolB protein